MTPGYLIFFPLSVSTLSLMSLLFVFVLKVISKRGKLLVKSREYVWVDAEQRIS